jgi:hypothetical protein
MRALVIVVALALSSVALGQDLAVEPKATKARLVPLQPIPVAYWLAECQGYPPAQNVSRRWDRERTSSILVQLPEGRVMVEAALLGSREAGWLLWSVIGPASLYKYHVSDPKTCRMVSTYDDAYASKDALWKDFAVSKSTCIGTEKTTALTASAACADAKTTTLNVTKIAPPVLYGAEDVNAKATLEAVAVEKVK